MKRYGAALVLCACLTTAPAQAELPERIDCWDATRDLNELWLSLDNLASAIASKTSRIPGDLGSKHIAVVDIVTSNVHGTITWDDPADAARLWLRIATWPAMRRRLLTCSAIVAPADAALPETIPAKPHP